MKQNPVSSSKDSPSVLAGNNLIERIRAAIDEDERIALAATPGPWHWDDEPNPGWGHQPPDLMSGTELVISSWGHDADGVSVSEPDMAHLARHSPDSVLRKVKGARLILSDLEYKLSGDADDLIANDMLKALAMMFDIKETP